MGTLSSHIALLPPIYRDKFASSFFIAKGNEILKKLSSEKLMRDMSFRRGVVVSNDVWITPPSNYRHVSRLHSPDDYNNEFAYIETDGKIMLTNNKITEEIDPDTVDTFSNFALDSIVVNIDGLDEDAYVNHLLVITSGTLANETIIISGNDESSGGTTKLYFQHRASSLLDAAKITGASIIQPDYYVMMIYFGSYVKLSSVDDEVPITDDFEDRIMSAGLMYKCCERHLGTNDRKTAEWERKFEKEVQELRNEFLSKPIQVKSRVWAGLADDSDLDGYSESVHGK